MKKYIIAMKFRLNHRWHFVNATSENMQEIMKQAERYLVTILEEKVTILELQKTDCLTGKSYYTESGEYIGIMSNRRHGWFSDIYKPTFRLYMYEGKIEMHDCTEK